MIELNRVLIVGRLTKDPDVRTIPSGKTVAKLDVAINRKGFGNQQDEVCFVEVIAWEKTAEFARGYLHKGSGVFVEGRLKMETWEDKTTGAKRSKINIVADRLAFAESKGAGEWEAAPKRAQDGEFVPHAELPKAKAPEAEADMGLPF
jgi:single-strand DNA-binding protein